MTHTTKDIPFIEQQRAKQILYFAQHGINMDEEFKKKNIDYYLADEKDNLFKNLAEKVITYFTEEHISFWNGSAIPNHILSSQVSCLNHLFPVRDDEDTSLLIANAITGMQFTDILPLHCDKKPQYITFEAVSSQDYLNEGKPNRGANCTSIDALMLCKNTRNEVILIAIEWKYTEFYRNTDKSTEKNPNKPDIPEARGQKRLDNYSELISQSKYLRHDISGDNHDAPYGNPSQYRKTLYFIEPFYQLMRQTLWAEQMMKYSQTEWTGKIDDYIHIHIIPNNNKELLEKQYKYCNKKGMEAAWQTCLSEAGQQRYKVVAPETIINILKEREKYNKLVKYLQERYYAE